MSPRRPAVGVRAVSVRQPWAWAILHAGKDVENRTWPTGYRGLLAVHAPKTVDTDAVAFLRACGVAVPDELVTGALLGTVHLAGCVRDVGSPWAEPGRWHWHLTHPRSLVEPIACRGALGLFALPPAVAAALAAGAAGGGA